MGACMGTNVGKRIIAAHDEQSAAILLQAHMSR